jgi:hypothetical protein
MVDVIGAYLRVVCLLPAQGQFVSDAVSKRLWFRKPATNTKYLQSGFNTTLSSTGICGNLRFTSIRTTQKKPMYDPDRNFGVTEKKNPPVNKTNILRYAQHTPLLNLLTNIHFSSTHTGFMF